MKRFYVLIITLFAIFSLSTAAHAAIYMYCPDCDTRGILHEVNATCTQYGYEEFECDECGYYRSYRTEPPLGHSYTIIVDRVEPTYTSSGSETYRCANCFSTRITSLPKLVCASHSWEESSRIDPTYTAPGSLTFVCSVCAETKTEELEQLACLSHSWVESARTDPTYESKGSVTYTCSICGSTKTESLPILVHTHMWTETDRIEATEDSSGIITYSCSCGQLRYDTLDYTSPVFDSTQALGKSFLSGVWGLFEVYVPGFSFTFGQMYLGVALCSISLLVIKLLFGIGGSGGQSPRTGSTNNPKISKERRNDKF